VTTMTYKHLLTRREGAIEYLTLNRPEVRNAFNDEVIADLASWAATVAADASVRAAVVSGAGSAFCAGADATWMASTIAFTEAENVQDAIAVSHMYNALNTLPVPLVGRVHGAALGGGAGLAAVCDVVVAGEQAVFGFTEVKLGILPAVISPFVLAKIGRSAARQLFLTGARFSSHRAREIGLVHEVAPEADLDTAVARQLSEILGAGREAVSAAKELIADVSQRPAEDLTRITAHAIASRRTSPEGQEGLRAFLEKRKPGWAR
jgi:methylglutaconyl-CoA hydratase